MCYTDWMVLASKKESGDAELFVLHKSLCWSPQKKLKVGFLDEITPAWPNGRGDSITRPEILTIANDWYRCGVNAGIDVVPEFVMCGPNDTSDIRVKFIGMLVII
jgi:hypothetical protein